MFFVHGGSSDMSDLATIASMNILARVAQRAAEHDTRVRVMNNDPIVTAVSQEVVQQAYTQAGRPDAFNPDDVSLVASDQFSYVAAVSGRMAREQPGAIFMLGSFCRRIAAAGRDRRLDRRDPGGRHRRVHAVAFLHHHLRLHADRRGAVRRLAPISPASRGFWAAFAGRTWARRS